MKTRHHSPLEARQAELKARLHDARVASIKETMVRVRARRRIEKQQQHAQRQQRRFYTS